MKFAVVCVLFVAFALVTCEASVQRQKRETCGPNEEYLDCGPSCQIECETLNEPCLIAHFRCPDGCYCINGYARDKMHGRCIPFEKC